MFFAIFIGICTTIILGAIILTEIENLNSNIITLKADIEAYIASKTGSVPAAEVQAAADAVAAVDAEVKAAH